MAKPQFTVEQVITALTESKGMVTVAAKKLGCSPTTVHNYIAKHTTIRDAMDAARDSQLDFAELKLFEEIKNNNTTAIIFYLKTVGKRRGYVERSEQVNYNVDAELLKKTIDAIEQAGLSAADVFNNILAEIDSAHVSAGGRSGADT